MSEKAGTPAQDLAHALDAARWAREDLGFHPDPWQGDVLRAQASRLLLLCCRQSGKSTVAAAMALHRALFWPGSLVLLLSPSLRQSGELFRKVSAFYNLLADPVASEAESALRLELANGSRIVSLPGTENTVRGFSGVDLLVIDEASRVEDDLYKAVRPMIAVSGGALVAVSTPFGQRGWFHDEWTAGLGWERVKRTAAECPRISPEFLEEERRTLGTWWFAQEYLCEFTAAAGALFGYGLVEAAFTSDVAPLFSGG